MMKVCVFSLLIIYLGIRQIFVIFDKFAIWKNKLVIKHSKLIRHNILIRTNLILKNLKLEK